MIKRSPTVHSFSKKEIDNMLKLLKKHKSVSLRNLCTIELGKLKKKRTYLDINTGKVRVLKAGSPKIVFRKAKYIKGKVKSI